jgi:hypothetical protein
MTPVSIFVVHIQNFSFSITAPLACTTSLCNETQLKHPFRLHFILTRTTDLIQIADPAFIRTRSATSFFVSARKNQCSAYPARNFSPISLPITF